MGVLPAEVKDSYSAQKMRARLSLHLEGVRAELC
jgi:hypothetical protein